MFEGPMGESIIGKAREKQLLELNVSNFRDFSDNKHQTVDDYPYGGGAGMLLKVQPIYDNLKAIEEETNQQPKRVILLYQQENRLIRKWPRNFHKKNI